MKEKSIKKSPYIKFTWIGQGWGYKEGCKLWCEIEDDDVIYVPEYGVEKDIDGNEYAETWYTKKDFIELCSVEGCPIEAETLFDMVDWQFPETLLDEIWEDR